MIVSSTKMKKIVQIMITLSILQKLLIVHSSELNLKLISAKSSDENIVKIELLEYNEEKYSVTFNIKKPLNDVLVR